MPWPSSLVTFARKFVKANSLKKMVSKKHKIPLWCFGYQAGKMSSLLIVFIQAKWEKMTGLKN